MGRRDRETTDALRIRVWCGLAVLALVSGGIAYVQRPAVEPTNAPQPAVEPTPAHVPTLPPDAAKA